MEEKAIRGVPWTLVSYGLSKALNVATIVVLARLLVPADFGLMTLALMATYFLYWFADLGFKNALIVRQDLDERGQGTVLTMMVAAGAGAAVIAAAISPLAAMAFDAPRLAPILSALGGILLIGGVSGFYEGLLQRELEFKRRFAGLMSQSAAAAVVSISLAALGAGVWSLVAGQLAGFTTLAAVLYAVAPHRVRPAFQVDAARDIFLTSRGFLAQGLANYIRQNVDNVVVGRAFGTAALGFYSMAYRLGDLTYWAIADPVARVTFPAFARSLARGEDIRGPFLSVLRLIALVGCPLGVILSASADPFTKAVFGDTWIPMIGPLIALGLWAALRPIETTMGWLLNSVGRAGAMGWLSAIILVPLIPALYLAGRFGTIIVVAIVIVVETAITMLVQMAMARRYAGLALRDQWRALQPVVLASPPAWLASWGVAQLLDGANPVGALALAILAGVATYAVVMSVLEPGMLKHAVSQILRTLGRAPTPTPS